MFSNSNTRVSDSPKSLISEECGVGGGVPNLGSDVHWFTVEWNGQLFVVSSLIFSAFIALTSVFFGACQYWQQQECCKGCLQNKKWLNMKVII